MTKNVLPYFPKLHSIEVDIHYFPKRDDVSSFFKFFSDTGYFHDIEQPRVAPTLKKVYINVSLGIGTPLHWHWICTSQDSGWQLERTSRFTTWDIMQSSATTSE